MTFRDREKERLIPLKPELFSAEACMDGEYNGTRYPFCLHEKFSDENIHPSIREDAIGYFSNRGISWHDGIAGEDGIRLPSNHLCCSQSCCVNFLFPFAQSPEDLKQVLLELGYHVNEVLPISLDLPTEGGGHSYVGFEWIGEKNYLHELSGGRPAAHDSRTRGSHFTSADFIIRFRQIDGRVRIILGEWKYTEFYPMENDKRFSASDTDRLKIYGPFLEKASSQLKLNSISSGSLFFDPFDQLMRQQLLASEMEAAREMGADAVSLLHIAPAQNHDLIDRITSPELANYGDTIHEVWGNITVEDRFKGVHQEDFLEVVSVHAPGDAWRDYMNLRYGG